MNKLKDWHHYCATEVMGYWAITSADDVVDIYSDRGLFVCYSKDYSPSTDHEQAEALYVAWLLKHRDYNLIHKTFVDGKDQLFHVVGLRKIDGENRYPWFVESSFPLAVNKVMAEAEGKEVEWEETA